MNSEKSEKSDPHILLLNLTDKIDLTRKDKQIALENSETSDSHRLLLNLTGKIDLRRKGKYIALSNISIYYTWKNIKRSYKHNKFKISAPTWNEEFELSDE